MTISERDRDSGFTLIEVLIALAILGISSALLISALSSLTRTANTGVARLYELDSERTIRSFLRSQLESAFPVTQTAEGSDEVFFRGDSESIAFIGRLPAHRGGGGLSMIRLSLQDRSDGDVLMLATTSDWEDRDSQAAVQAGNWEQRDLVRNVDALDISYFGNRSESSAPVWSDNWTRVDRLPSLIKLEVIVGDREWPPLIALVRSPSAFGQPQMLLKRLAEGI